MTLIICTRSYVRRVSHMKKIAPVLLVLVAALAFAKDGPIPELRDLDHLITESAAQWHVPGMAVGIVRDGKVVFAQGYGYRNLEQKLPVTTKTLFPIGSVSKSFTALSIAVLNDRGKLAWDTPVRQYLPTFQLKDSVASERATVRDLLSHRTGLARHDVLWYSSDFTRKDIFERLQYLDMSKDFRSAYQYNNLMVMTAGYLAGEVSGGSWEKLVRETIFTPLDMAASNFDDADSQKSEDYALPYAEVKGAIKPIPFKPVHAIGPAGGINSNLDEMLHYTLMLLANGKYGDKRIVSESALKEIQSPQTVMGTSPRFTELGYPAYGMGWVVQAYRGHNYIWHNGGIDGFYSLVCLLPNDNIGLVILTNRLGHSASEVIAYSIFDRLLHLEPLPWGERFEALEAKGKQAAAEEEKQAVADRKPGTHPSHELREYAGTYENPGYGTARVTFANGKLSFALNTLSAPIEHYHYDVFMTPNDDENMLALTKLRFNTGSNGEIESLAIPLQPDVADIVFRRIEEKKSAVTDWE